MATAALPAVPAGFTGRDEDLARLMPVLDPSAESDLPVVICAVSGLGGMGKTSLALCAAHRAVGAGWFPGGTLFVDFRGYDEDPVTADQALVALLDGMGVRGAELPQTVTAQYALYRRLLAEERRSMLLILDNASDAAQIEPLVPGTDHHRVLVTSRNRLTSLDARLLDLAVLKPEGAAELIGRSLRLSDGRDDRAAREPEAVAELAMLCGHHPLALRIAVGMLRKRRYRTIASLVDEVRKAEDRVWALGVRPVFEVAYRQLPPEQGKMLRLLCLAPTTEVSSAVAGALAGLGADQTVGLLEELASSHLVTPVPTDDDVRWRLHDLVRAFGAALVFADVGLRAEGEAARDRVFEFYRRWAARADERLRFVPGGPEPEGFANRTQALAWLDRERAGLVAAAQWARDERYGETAVWLALDLAAYLVWRRYFDDLITVVATAQEVAHRTGDGLAEAIAWNHLGTALRETGRAEKAIDAHIQARDLYRRRDDRHREAIAWNLLGIALMEAERPGEAVEAHIRARNLFMVVGDRGRAATAWTYLGSALQGAGRLAEAIEAHTRARRSAPGRAGSGLVWNNFGNALWEAGRADEAVAAYRRSLRIHREFEDWYGVGKALANLALTREASHQPAEARTHYLQAVDAYTRANAPEEAANCQSAADALT